MLIGLTERHGQRPGVGQPPEHQGALGLYSDQAAWMTTVYTMTNVSMSLLLVKFRQQFGLVPFARIFLAAYIRSDGRPYLRS